MATNVANKLFSFNQSGILFSFYGDDGKLKIWDTSTCVLKHEYTKNFHLSSPCTCLLWLPVSKQHGSKRKKIKTSEGENLDVMALGTSSGNVLLYNVTTNNIVSQLEGHTAKVNNLSYSNSNQLYSCSDDKHIIEWDLVQQKIKSKWKAGKEKIHSILALSDDKSLLSASCSIKLWDLEKKSVIKTFIGHATEVTTLIEVPEKDSYFISAAVGDRVISAWSFKNTQESTSAVASFVLQDGAASVHLSDSTKDTTCICAVTDSGILQVFKHQLNGTMSKPVKASLVLTIASEIAAESMEMSRPIPIHAALTVRNKNILIAYGNLAFLSFETVNMCKSESERNMVLVRQDRRKLAPDEFNSKTKVPQIGEDAEYQMPGKTPSKRSKSNEADVPLAERLEKLALAKPLSGDTPKKDNMAQLLIQGLQSKDRVILQEILFKNDDAMISSTVKHLPIHVLVSLINELMTLLQGKTYTSKVAVQWLMAVFRSHSGYLLSNPDVVAMFEPLRVSMEARVSVLAPLMRLRGRLNLVTEQIRTTGSEEADEIPAALVSFEEPESSDESDVDMSEDELEDNENSDELSEMEYDEK